MGLMIEEFAVPAAFDPRDVEIASRCGEAVVEALGSQAREGGGSIAPNGLPRAGSVAVAKTFDPYPLLAIGYPRAR